MQSAEHRTRLKITVFSHTPKTRLYFNPVYS